MPLPEQRYIALFWEAKMLNLSRNAPHHLTYLKRCDHVAFICANPEQWQQLVVLFMREGLANKELIYYLYGLYRPQQIYALLDSQNIPVAHDSQGRQIYLKPARSFFLADGYADAAANMEQLSREVERAQSAGLNGLRLLLDMNWVGAHVDRCEVLRECERLAEGYFFSYHSCLAVCHYERSLLSSRELRWVRKSHAMIIDGDHIHSNCSQKRARISSKRRVIDIQRPRIPQCL